jgi:hypothetical protein
VDQNPLVSMLFHSTPRLRLNSCIKRNAFHYQLVQNNIKNSLRDQPKFLLIFGERCESSISIQCDRYRCDTNIWPIIETGSGMFIPDPGSQIPHPDPKSATKESNEKKLLSYLFCGHKSQI